MSHVATSPNAAPHQAQSSALRPLDPGARGQDAPESAIQEADRNLSHRVEVVAPVPAPEARARLREILDVALRDRRQAWLMEPDGSYTQATPAAGDTGAESLGSHQTLMDRIRRTF